jgi:L-asparaginase II
MKTLAVVTRSKYIESLHQGYICVVDCTGKVQYQKGDINTKIYFRSAAKPIQVIPFIQSGAGKALGFTPKEISLACSSHFGDPSHQETALKMLKRVNLDETHLHCGAKVPYDLNESRRLVERGEKPSTLHAACSGKHSAMLALSKYWGLDISHYENILHPVQQEILKVIAEFTDEDAQSIPIGIDGCGLPIYLLPIYKIALSYARLTMNSQDESCIYHNACKTVFDAMTQHPDMVAGVGQFCTELMQATGGKLIGKVGAEAVYCVGIKEGNLGVCVKIADGNERAVFPVVIQLLRELNALDDDELEKLKSWHITSLTNNLEEHIGSIFPVFHHTEDLRLGDSVPRELSKDPSP